MSAIKKYQDIINTEISFILNEPLQNPDELYEPINYILSLDGKRIRPALLLASCEMFGGDISKAIYPAIGIEVFHNFTLVHDDIMDNAPLRRNQATVHSRWNRNTAILSGDVMMVKAYQYIAQCELEFLPRVLSIFSAMATQVCEGQQWDMNFETRKDVSIEEYLNMINLKTAVMLAGSLKIGAILGGAYEKDARHIYEFGKYLGLAFQLQDDILDVFGDQSKFGKKAGGDIISNKKTFLYLKAMEMANELLRLKMNKLVHSTNFVEEDKIKTFTEIYNTLGVKEIAKQKMHGFYENALKHLSSINLAPPKKNL